MDPSQIAMLAVIGVFTGVISALAGVGGGIVVIPLLTLVYGMDQKSAAATSLAMLLPPIGIFAVMQYYQRGLVDVKVAAALAIPFAVGALVGARYVMPHINDRVLKVGFSCILIYAASIMLWKSQPKERAVLIALVLATAWGVGYLLLGRLGTRWNRLRPAADFYRPPASRQPEAIDFEI